jgi:hypothetical protein
MWTGSFWKQTLERAIRTAAQIALSFWVVGETGILDVDWMQFGSVVALGAFSSVAMSIVATGVGDHESPSVVRVDK